LLEKWKSADKTGNCDEKKNKKSSNEHYHQTLKAQDVKIE
jgi:hypothetical protein